jgi:radical SAM protein with 4Fe4S-binding SPASM domain
VLNNIENLLKIRGSVLKVYLFFTCLPENIKEIRLFRRIWESKVDGINIGRAREIDNLNPLSRKQLAPCPYLWQRMFVLWNGDVVACCSDSDAKLVIGNVWASGIYGVWKSSKFEQIRKLHLSYQSNNIVLCNNCQLNLWLRWIVYFRF